MKMISQLTSSHRHDHNMPRYSERKLQHRQWWQCFFKGKTTHLIFWSFLAVNLFGLLQYRRTMNHLVRETITINNDEYLKSYQYHQDPRKDAEDRNDVESENILRIKTNQSSPRAEEDPLAQNALHNKSNVSEMVWNDHHHHHHHHHNQHDRQHHQQLKNETVSSTLTMSSNKGDNGGRFAYAFLLGGAMTTKPGADYRPALYSIFVAAYNLRRHGSKADIVVMVQMSATTNATKLPEVEESILLAMNIRIKYIPKYSHPKLECFYSLMMEKFRILEWEEYSRVLYLDADVLPLCNLDYVMELSEQGDVLRDNVVVSYKGEPASGGFFVLKPNASDYQELIEIIRKTEGEYLQMPYPHWDVLEGWGHVLDESDPWYSTKLGIFGTNWTFYGSYADQGLLFYWTKYYKKSVSIINTLIVNHWGVEPETNTLRLLRHDYDSLQAHNCNNTDGQRSKLIGAPYCNFVHLTGRSKPWYKNRTALEERINAKYNATTINKYSDEEYWYWLLKNALHETGLRSSLNLDFIGKRTSGVGTSPSFVQRANYIRRKASNGWRQYEYEEIEARKRANPERQAHDIVTALENFQPRTALKPHLSRIQALQNDLELSLEPKTVRGEGIVSQSTDTRKWAYAFLLGGARYSSRGTNYLGGLYSVIVAVYQLRKLGSRADFILMVQIAAKSPHQKLSDFDEEILQKMNIKVVYIPKFASRSMECFYSLMMEKFRILTFTEYSRVMYLDNDIFPKCNLDYLFDLSDPLPSSPEVGSTETNQPADAAFRMKENVIVAYRSEPSSGGIFILKPDADDYAQIQRIILEKEMRSLEQPYPHWDSVSGWGHVIEQPDYWKDVRGRIASNWTWYGVKADQGLLYYWTKYVKKSVSIISRDDVEQWEPDYWDTDSNGKLFLRQTEVDVPKIVKKALKNYGCPLDGFLLAPYNDFIHLTGKAKPWFRPREELENADCGEYEKECKMRAKWYSVLKELLVSIDILDRFSWDFLGTRRSSPVGHAPTDSQIADYIAAKKKKNWNPYEELMSE